MAHATVSVIIPCYNGSRYLRQSIESALGQSFPPLEVLVIDDGSVDDSARIGEAYGAPVRVIRQKNQGESVARNEGLSKARGQWVAFLDVDDVWAPQKTERQLALASREPQHVCLFTAYYEFGDRSGEARIPRKLLDGTYDRELVAPVFTLLPSSALVRADARARFPTWTTYSEDGIYFNDLSLEGTFGFVDEPLVGYRRHAASGQRKQHNHRLACESYWRWAGQKEREPAERLKNKLLTHLAHSAQRAKWKRDWAQFHELREFCLANWPPSRPLHPVLKARVWPPLFYRVKDLLDRRAFGSRRRE